MQPGLFSNAAVICQQASSCHWDKALQLYLVTDVAGNVRAYTEIALLGTFNLVAKAIQLRHADTTAEIIEFPGKVQPVERSGGH